MLSCHVFLTALLTIASLVNGNLALANNELLRVLSERLLQDNRRLEDFGLPGYIEMTTELIYQQQLYDAPQQRELFDDLTQTAPNTEEMQALLNIISQHLASKRDCIILLQGQAGCGKSTFAKKVAALARSLKHIVLGCASTGLAATVYENFYTAHSLFKIPVIPDTIFSLPFLII